MFPVAGLSAADYSLSISQTSTEQRRVVVEVVVVGVVSLPFCPESD